ncbi:MAG: TIGR02266 family protein [Bdellovibrionales bacterium]|nr:TIGR02266 family protein [Bdellovibrionales bacterium]
MSGRRDKRISTRLPIKFQVDFHSDGHFLIEYATNISEHGIFIQTNQPLKKGTVLELEFLIPDSNQKVKAIGKVVWVNPYRKNSEKNYNPGMGVQFENLSDIDRETLLTSIKKVAVL